jgi:hypothetical protein
VYTPKKQCFNNKNAYLLTRKDRSKHVWLSRGDHYGVKWWAKQQNITVTETLHDMIHEFMTKRLEAYKQKGIEIAVSNLLLYDFVKSYNWHFRCTLWQRILNHLDSVA